MEISELTLKLIILLIPGAIASIIFEKLTIHKKWSSFQFVANSILFGGLSYLLAEFTIDRWLHTNALLTFWENLPSKDIQFNAITEGILASILIGLACAGLDNYKLTNKIGKWLRLTNKYGDENLFSYLLNSKNVAEVYVREIENNITYHGLIDSFSETDEIKELVLRDVKVYDYLATRLFYELDKLYLAKPTDKLTIEIPFKTQITSNGSETTSEVAASK